MKSNFKPIRLKASGLMVLVLGAVYLLFSVGIIKSTHFCMGREASVAYFTSESKKCACGLFAPEKDGCCDDERELIKLEDSQKNISSFIFLSTAWVLLEQPKHLTTLGDYHAPVFLPDADDLGPPIRLFKIYCSLRFYEDVLSV